MTEMFIWPAYLDADRSRNEGRRIAKDTAVSDPSADEIAKAVKQIGYEAIIERDKKYPKSWWENEGRVLVKDADDSKRDMLPAIAAYIDAMRN
ncbi:MAG: signal recognition particle subunit SRP19/SEC65 family protein [Halobacteria archaeon]|nr:signal recognition particle subunit SRP19/SEC65 family protein [Halobacteria archaeon]